MKLTALGTGSAFTQENYQTNFLIELDSGYKLLVDCGGDVRFALKEQGYEHLDINGIYVSHLHSDHVGGLEYMAFATYFDPRYQGRPDLYCSEFLVDDLWNRCLSGGLSSLQNKRATLETYFNVHAVPKNGCFQAGGTGPDFRLAQVVHFLDSFTFQFSFGLMFKQAGERIFITTDTQYAPVQIQDFYNEATVIFHDTETSPFQSGVHAHFDELKQLDEKTRAKLRLVHYQDNVVLDQETWDAKAAEAGFAGFVRKGQVFNF